VFIELARSFGSRVHRARAFIGLARSSSSRDHRACAIIKLARSSSSRVHSARAIIELARSSSMRVHRACAFIELARSSSLSGCRECAAVRAQRGLEEFFNTSCAFFCGKRVAFFFDLRTTTNLKQGRPLAVHWLKALMPRLDERGPDETRHECLIESEAGAVAGNVGTRQTFPRCRRRPSPRGASERLSQHLFIGGRIVAKKAAVKKAAPKKAAKKAAVKKKK
jgi:hypothetical protein